MKQYKILGQMKMEKLEEELNRLAACGESQNFAFVT
jgi:hypothetical protein